MKRKLIIVDDTKEESTITKLTVQKILPSLHNEYSISVRNLSDTISDFFSYDLYILDINMQGEKLGFQLAKLINEQNKSASIIFCTNYDDLVFEAYYIDILFFVRKKHLEQDMLQAFMKYEALELKKHTINIKTKTGYKKISISDILYIESSHNNCYLHTITKEVFDIPKSMSSFLKELNEPSIMKINPSTAVNMSYVTQIDNFKLYVRGVKDLEVSRRKLKKVKEYFLRETSWK